MNMPESLPPEIAPERLAARGADTPPDAARAFGLSRRRVVVRWVFRLALGLALAGLLYFALHEAPVEEIWRVLSTLRAWQLLLLLGVNAIIYALVTARWWIVVQAEKPLVRYLPLIAVRLSVFAISYFTLGPQVGGEPLQILYLHRKYGVSLARAAASVVMDKLFELLGNFVLLCFGVIAVFHSGILSGVSEASKLVLLGLGSIVAWPLIHILLLYNRIYPVSAFLRLLGPRITAHKAVRFTRASEHLAGQFCQRHPRAMLGGLLMSLLAAAATVSEYALITSFLRISLPFWKVITAWTTGWLAFLMPLPGGMGALEAGQVSVLGLFGISAATAISVVLVMRGRDLFLGGLGLLLAGNSARRP